MIQDVLIGATPPVALRDWRYTATAFTGAAATALFHGPIQRRPAGAMPLPDALGLALFTIAGTEKALDLGILAFIAALLGTITATGGGTLRDVLLARIPAVLRIDFYAPPRWPAPSCSSFSEDCASATGPQHSPASSPAWRSASSPCACTGICRL